MNLAAIARSPRLITAFVLAALLGGFGLLADEVAEGDTLSFDQTILNALRTPGNPSDPLGPLWFEEMVRDITSLGSLIILGLITTLVVVTLALRGKHQTAWFLTIVVLGGTLVVQVLKALFDRPRPDFESTARVFTASFPSGHAGVSAVVFLTIGIILASSEQRRSLQVFYLGVSVVLTIIVGCSRIYMGVHYPTDVLAGWMIGSAWALLCWAAYQLIVKRNPAADTASDVPAGR